MAESKTCCGLARLVIHPLLAFEVTRQALDVESVVFVPRGRIEQLLGGSWLEIITGYAAELRNHEADRRKANLPGSPLPIVDVANLKVSRTIRLAYTNHNATLIVGQTDDDAIMMVIDTAYQLKFDLAPSQNLAIWLLNLATLPDEEWRDSLNGCPSDLSTEVVNKTSWFFRNAGFSDEEIGQLFVPTGVTPSPRA